MYKYRIFCTHHSPLVNRKEYILEKQKEYGFECTFVESHQPGVSMIHNDTNIKDSELSLYLKHIEIYKRIVDDDEKFGFIIEDDLIIDRDLNVFFKQIIEESDGYDIIFFGGTYSLVVSNSVEGKLVYGGYNTTRCTHGYFISKNCAQILLSDNNLNFESPIDHTLNKLIVSLNLKTAWTYPHLLQKTVEGHEPTSIIR